MRRLLTAAILVAAFATPGCTRLLLGKKKASPEEAAVGPPGPPDCSTLDKRFATLPEDPVRGCGWGCEEGGAERMDAAIHAFARQYATCKQYAGLFERVAARDAGAAALIALDAEGQPIEAAFVEYMRTHRGPAFLRIAEPGAAMRGVTRWLVDKRHMSHCQELAGALNGASPDANGGAVGYFYKTRCSEALPRLVVALGSEWYLLRMDACEALGTLGDASVLPFLHKMATDDSFSRGVADPAAEAREDAAREAAHEAESDEEWDQATEELGDAEFDSRASETTTYPVRQQCAAAHRTLARRVAPPSPPPGRGRKVPAPARRGRR